MLWILQNFEGEYRAHSLQTKREKEGQDVYQSKVCTVHWLSTAQYRDLGSLAEQGRDQHGHFPLHILSQYSPICVYLI